MIVGYCILNGKKWVMFEDKQCAAGEVKLTDGFKDKLIRWNSDKLIGIGPAPKFRDRYSSIISIESKFLISV